MENKNPRMSDELKLLAERLSLESLDNALKFPKYFEVETIRACNARCRMCPVWKLDGKGTVMKDELFAKIVKEMSGYADWINRVCISRDGEPLLDRKLVERIKMLKEAGIKEVSFSTNASILSEKKSIELIRAGLDDIRFSIDGATKKTFELIRQGLNFEKIVENCLRFIKLRDKINGKNGKPKIHIRMVLQKANENEEKAFRDFWKSKVSESDVVSAKPMHSWGARLENYEGKENEIEKYSGIPCISPWSTMIIHFNGKVPLCGCDFENKVLLGDANKKSIKEIWQSEKFDRIREMHASGKRNEIELCPGCNIWDLNIKKIYKIRE